MDPTSSYREAPKPPSPPPPAEYTVAGQTAHLDNEDCVHKIDTTIYCKVESGIISKLSGACLRALQQILKDTDLELMPKRELKVLRRVIGAFILWDDGYGAQAGLLDARLKRSNQLYGTVLSLLRSLCKSTQYGK
jgi:hypothetical protein